MIDLERRLRELAVEQARATIAGDVVRARDLVAEGLRLREAMPARPRSHELPTYGALDRYEAHLHSVRFLDVAKAA